MKKIYWLHITFRNSPAAVPLYFPEGIAADTADKLRIFLRDAEQKGEFTYCLSSMPDLYDALHAAAQKLGVVFDDPPCDYTIVI